MKIAIAFLMLAVLVVGFECARKCVMYVCMYVCIIVLLTTITVQNHSRYKI